MSRFLFRAGLVLALFLIILAAIAGAFHLRVWQQNPEPEVESVRWANAEGRLGSATQLEVDVRMPWHRHLIAPIKPAAPAHLVVGDNPVFQPGIWSPLGWRRHRIFLPMIPLAAADPTKPPLLELPLRRSRATSTRTLRVTIPQLAIAAADRPDTVALSLQPLDEPLEPAPGIAAATTPPVAWKQWIPIAVLLAALIPLLLFALRSWSRRPARPAWKTALQRLRHLERTAPKNTAAFFTRWDAILKSYFADAADDPTATSASSSELRAFLARHRNATPELQSAFAAACRDADLARFADRDPGRKQCKSALRVARQVIEQTRPSDPRAPTSSSAVPAFAAPPTGGTQ